MSVLLIAEHDNKSLKEATAKAATAALKIGTPVDILVAGSGAKAVADAAAKIAGIGKVLFADDAQYANQLAEPMAARPALTVFGRTFYTERVTTQPSAGSGEHSSRRRSRVPAEPVCP